MVCGFWWFDVLGVPKRKTKWFLRVSALRGLMILLWVKADLYLFGDENNSPTELSTLKAFGMFTTVPPY